MSEDKNEGSTLGASISEASWNLWIRPWEVSRLLGEPHPKPLLATSCSYDCPLLRGINKEGSESCDKESEASPMSGAPECNSGY